MANDLEDGSAVFQDGTHDLQRAAEPLGDAGTPPLQPPPPRQASGRHAARKRASEDAIRVTCRDLWGEVPIEDDPIRRASEREPAMLCALLMLLDALARAPDFPALAERPGTVSVIHVPDRSWGRCIAEAWELVVDAREVAASAAPDGQTASTRRQPPRGMDSVQRQKSDPVKGADQFQVFEKRGRSVDGIDFLKDAVARGKAIHVFTTDPEELLATDILVVEMQRLRIPPPSLQILVKLASLNHLQSDQPRDARAAVCPNLANAAVDISPLILNVAYHASQTPKAFLRQLEVLLEKQRALSAGPPPRPVLTLDSLPGLGAAGVWGRQMAADLRSYAEGTLPWSELDRGVVLEGPPGVGKSTFARALAGSAGLPLIVSSLAQWQGSRDGHLGHLLSAMQATFERARGSAPCVLLLDEIDSFPSRVSVTHKHRDYVVEVVNGLLEQLDGAVERTGVVVIGTCNDAGNLDPALTRAGRLERIIRVDRPDADGIQQILRFHLGDALTEDDLKPLAVTAAMRGAVGADIEAWCRRARRLARSAGRPVILDDLVEEIGPPPPRHSPDAIRRIAAHEAGHAIAFALMGTGILKQVAIDPIIGARSTTTVDGLSLYRDMPHVTREHAMAKIRATLAGRAAEEVVLGSPSGGAGGAEGSDLARATTLACMIVASSGLDDHVDGLVYLSSAKDYRRLDQLLLLPEIRHRVSKIIRRAYAGALHLMNDHKAGVELIAAALVERGSLSGTDVETLLARLPGDRLA